MSELTNPTKPTGPTGTARVKRGMAEMLKGGVIMDVVTPEQVKIAEDAGAVAVMALERVPADIRAQGGVRTRSNVCAFLSVGLRSVLVCQESGGLRG